MEIWGTGFYEVIEFYDSKEAYISDTQYMTSMFQTMPTIGATLRATFHPLPIHTFYCCKMICEYSQNRAQDSTAYIDGLVHERHNSIANALELRLSCTNPSISCLPLLPICHTLGETTHLVDGHRTLPWERWRGYSRTSRNHFLHMTPGWRPCQSCCGLPGTASGR